MKHRSTPATVLGATLLLVGIAGVATASAPGHEVSAKAKASVVKKNSVKSVHIKDGTVRKKDLSTAVRAALAKTPAPVEVPTPLPPKAYAAAPENSVNIPFDSDTQVVSKTLPKGTYAVQVNLTLYTNQSGLASCSLLVNSDAQHIAQHTFAAGGGRASISLSSIVGSAAEITPSVECWTPGIGNASEIRLSAIQVTP